MQIKTLLLSASLMMATAFNGLKAQDDLLALVSDSTKSDLGSMPVYATFKTTKIINSQSTETVKKKTLDFRITHRFGNIGGASGGGGHTLFGFDQSDDIRFSFDYGITNKLQIGIGRSKAYELLDGSVKWRFLEQTENSKIPVTMCLYGSMGFTPMVESALYPANVIVPNKGNISHRVNYFSQVQVARKFNNSVSLQLVGAYHHRNFIVENTNASNGAKETNDLISVGIGGRIKITKRIAFIADYYYVLSPYRQNNTLTPFENPLGLGIEIETGGHVFHLTFTNASNILENNFIPNTRDQWMKGGFKFGFNISRVFNM